jgi:hypothetical protein
MDGKRSLARWAAALVVALGLLVGFAVPASAAELPVSGTYAGSALLTTDCLVPGGRNAGHTVDATGTLEPLGDVEVDGLVCLAVVPQELVGSFSISTADGSLRAVGAGTLSTIGDFVFAEDMTLTVTRGTGRFDRATGTLHVDAVFDLIGQSATGDVEGTLTLPDGGTTG